jgi:hypothetical protein
MCVCVCVCVWIVGIHFVFLSKKGRKMSLKYPYKFLVFSENLGSTICSSNSTSHANLTIVKGNFKSLFRINIAPVSIVLSNDISTHREPRLIVEKK